MPQLPGPPTWWRRRAQRRSKAGGGLFAGLTPPRPVRFNPTPVDKAAAIKQITEQAAGLVPGAVDEALPYTLDNQINARTDQWIAQVHSEFAQHRTGLDYLHKRAGASVGQETQRQPPDTHRVIETETARNTAATRLRGEQEKPAWTEPGHADPTQLGGRPRGHYLYALAILLAAAADIAAFYQVIELVLGGLYTWLVAILVVGFTGTALTLAHFTGVMLRDRKAGAKWILTFMIVAAAVIWVALGALAFWVRLHSVASSSSGYTPSVGGSSASSSGAISTQGTPSAAAMFVGLYAATGAVAMIGAYLTHNPLRGAHAQAARAHRKAAKDHANSARRLGLTEAERDFYAGQITAAERVRDEAIKDRLALSEELKQLARIEFARHLHDASATDAFVTDDARPYTFRPFPS
jgi:hypothetical protein